MVDGVLFTKQASLQIREIVRREIAEARGDRLPPSEKQRIERAHLWALTPADGIPARDELLLGNATCEMFTEEVDTFGSDARSLVAIIVPGGEAKTDAVHNCGTSDVGGDKYVAIERTDGGGWRIVPAPERKRHGFTPSGGIPEATKSGDTITPGSATVDEWEFDWDSMKYVPLLKDSVQVEVTVYSEWPGDIRGDTWISFSHDDDGLLTIDNEACEDF